MHRRLLVWAVVTLLVGVTVAVVADPEDDSVTAAGVPTPRIEARQPRETSGGTVSPGSTIVARAPSDPVLGAAPTTEVTGGVGGEPAGEVPVGPVPVPVGEPAPAPAPAPPMADDALQLRLSGRIVDSSGAPATDMCVTATPSPIPPPMPGNRASTITGPDGRYVLEARDLVVSSDPQGWRVSAYDCGTRVPGLLGPSAELTVPLGGDATFDGTATTGVAVRVHAVDAGGAPVVGFCIQTGRPTPTDADGIALFRTLTPGAPLQGALGCRDTADGGGVTGAPMELGGAPQQPGTVDDRTVLIPPAPGDDRRSPVRLAADRQVDGENAYWAPHTLTATGSSDEPAPLCAPGPVQRSVWASLDDVRGSLGVRAHGRGTLGIWREVGDTLVPLGCLSVGDAATSTIEATGPVVVQFAATEPGSFAIVFFDT